MGAGSVNPLILLVFLLAEAALQEAFESLVMSDFTPGCCAYAKHTMQDGGNHPILP